LYSLAPCLYCLRTLVNMYKLKAFLNLLINVSSSKPVSCFRIALSIGFSKVFIKNLFTKSLSLVANKFLPNNALENSWIKNDDIALSSLKWTLREESNVLNLSIFSMSCILAWAAKLSTADSVSTLRYPLRLSNSSIKSSI